MNRLSTSNFNVPTSTILQLKQYPANRAAMKSEAMCNGLWYSLLGSIQVTSHDPLHSMTPVLSIRNKVLRIAFKLLMHYVTELTPLLQLNSILSSEWFSFLNEFFVINKENVDSRISTEYHKEYLVYIITYFFFK